MCTGRSFRKALKAQQLFKEVRKVEKKMRHSISAEEAAALQQENENTSQSPQLYPNKNVRPTCQKQRR